MAAERQARVDVAVFGGGIAGLWLLHRLRAAGYVAVLLETDRLGAGQTIASQGIIHGGLKYALDLKLGAAARAIGDMPALWRRCLVGSGEIDLSSVPRLAENHLMWLPPGLLGKATGFFASRAVRARTAKLAAADWPLVLKDQPTVGALYALDEPVLDVPALLATLAKANRGAVRAILAGADGLRIERDGGGAPVAALLHGADGETVRLTARRFVFTAGAGNEAVLDALDRPPVSAQRRPLRMVLVRGVPGPLYAHCFDVSDKPRLTITSHRRRDGDWVWYLGGQIAEAGATLAAAATIVRAKQELAALLPGLSQEGWRWATLAIDRAEAAQAGGKRPERPVVAAAGNSLIAWPTKLAFAPLLAAEVLGRLRQDGVLPGGDAGQDVAALDLLPEPAVAEPPWETATWE